MIQRAVYTYWTNNGSKYVCGFPTEQHFESIFNQSLYNSNQFFDEVVVYTDEKGAEKLEELQIDCQKVIIDYSEYDFDTRFWNFPKLITYSLQTVPFVHIDIDLILKENPLLDCDIVSEMNRGAVILSSDYKFLGKEIYSEYDPLLICSGLLGGNNVDVFKELYEIASEKVKLENTINLNVTFNKLVAIEEIILTILKNRQGLNVQYLNTEFEHYQGSKKSKL